MDGDNFSIEPLAAIESNVNHLLSIADLKTKQDVLRLCLNHPDIAANFIACIINLTSDTRRITYR
jgi:hypothetical protein